MRKTLSTSFVLLKVTTDSFSLKTSFTHKYMISLSSNDIDNSIELRTNYHLSECGCQVKVRIWNKLYIYYMASLTHFTRGSIILESSWSRATLIWELSKIPTSKTVYSMKNTIIMTLINIEIISKNNLRTKEAEFVEPYDVCSIREKWEKIHLILRSTLTL